MIKVSYLQTLDSATEVLPTCYDECRKAAAESFFCLTLNEHELKD